MPATCAHVGRYQQSWQAMGKAEVEIAELGKDVEVGRPLGLVSVPPCRTVPGPVNPGTYFAFGRRPFTAKPFAIAGLGCLITPPPFSEKLINDPRPLHAFLRAGCPVAAWSEADGAMRFLHKDISATPGSFDAHDGVVTFDPPRSLATIEHIRIRTTGKATGGELPELHIHFFGGVRQGKEKIFDVDVSRNGPSLHEILGGRELADLKVELEVGEVLDVQVKDRVPRLELVRRLDGSRVSAEKLEATIVAPLPKQRAPMHIVLIGESSGFTWSVQAGVPVTIPLPVLDLIRAFAQRLETRRYHYYFQTTAPQQGSPGSARSDLDWFTLDGG